MGIKKLSVGSSYLIVTDSVMNAFSVFIENLDKKGLIVSRNSKSKCPKIIQKKNVKIMWLTNVKSSESHISPDKLEQISYDIEIFMVQNPNSVVLFMGVEYMMSYNSFLDIFHMILDLKDIAEVHKSTFIIHIGKNTLDVIERSVLEQELIVIGDSNENN